MQQGCHMELTIAYRRLANAKDNMLAIRTII